MVFLKFKRKACITYCYQHFKTTLYNLVMIFNQKWRTCAITDNNRVIIQDCLHIKVIKNVFRIQIVIKIGLFKD